MLKTRIDYIIVGQGIAGSSFAMQLMKRNLNFVVYDVPENNNSSSVAGGLFNPITGKNWVKTWKADTLFPYMRTFFRSVEDQLDIKIFHERTIYRPFQSLDIQNDWMGKEADPFHSPYIRVIHTEPIDEEIVKNPLGGLELNWGGYIDVPKYLNGVKKKLVDTSSIIFSTFNERDIFHTEEMIGYQNYLAKKIVFCQGHQAGAGSLWNYLPFRPVKGEILTLSVEEKFDNILNMGVFVLPQADGKWKVGATYDYNNIDLKTTESGKNQIINKLNRFFLPKFDVVGHVAGIRPATLDRRPFIGMHPNVKNIVIFNGLGAKGVTLAPYFSEVLLNFLEHGVELEKEINVARFN